MTFELYGSGWPSEIISGGGVVVRALSGIWRGEAVRSNWKDI